MNLNLGGRGLGLARVIPTVSYTRAGAHILLPITLHAAGAKQQGVCAVGVRCGGCVRPKLSSCRFVISGLL